MAHGLKWPADPVKYPVTQGFAGDHPFEWPGFLELDAGGPRRARKTKFDGAVEREDLHGALDQGTPLGTVLIAPERSTLVIAGTYWETGEHYAMLEVQPGTILFFTHIKKGGLLVPVGKRVKRGSPFALSGNSGMSTAPHLHWEVRKNSDADADPRASATWFKWNPKRLVVGGDLAGVDWIRPL